MSTITVILLVILFCIWQMVFLKKMKSKCDWNYSSEITFRQYNTHFFLYMYMIIFRKFLLVKPHWSARVSQNTFNMLYHGEVDAESSQIT